MNRIRNKYVVVAGAARSGVAVASLLHRHGAKVLLTEAGRVQAAFRDRLAREQIQFEEEGHSPASNQGDMLVVSPGIGDDAPLVRGYLERGAAVYSEIEVASWLCRSRIVAVTGSNGKTTVVNWLADIWKRAGRPYLLAGNVGTAFSDVVEQTGSGVDVLLEVSSFQLDHIDRFRASVAILLNITPDHLDRYKNMFEYYIASKMRLVANQTTEDTLIYGFDDPVVKAQADRLAAAGHPAAMFPFSSEAMVPGACLRDGMLCLEPLNRTEKLMAVDQLALRGRHNVRNGLAVALAARVCEIDKEPIRESLSRFEGVPHRLQKVRVHEGITWYNDSKATNVNAVWYALSSFQGPVVLVLGGRDKGNDYGELYEEVRRKVKAVVAVGESRNTIVRAFAGIVPVVPVDGSMTDIVGEAGRLAESGDTVLLSPACSSFDMFENYEDRGHKFIQSVMALQQ